MQDSWTTLLQYEVIQVMTSSLYLVRQGSQPGRPLGAHVTYSYRAAFMTDCSRSLTLTHTSPFDRCQGVQCQQRYKSSDTPAGTLLMAFQLSTSSSLQRCLIFRFAGERFASRRGQTAAKVDGGRCAGIIEGRRPKQCNQGSLRGLCHFVQRCDSVKYIC